MGKTSAIRPLSFGRDGLAFFHERLLLQFGAERERWFLWVPVSMGVGISIYFTLPYELSLVLPVTLFFGSVSLCFFLRDRCLSFLCAGFLAGIVLGFLAAKCRTILVSTPVLATELYNVKVYGFIESLTPLSQNRTRIIVFVSRMDDIHQKTGRVSINVRGACATPSCVPGQPVWISASILRPPPTASVPGGYDFARTAYFQSIGAVGFSRRLPEHWDTDISPPFSVQVRAAVNRYRYALAERITAVLEGDVAAMVVALLLGIRGGISQEVLDALRYSGLAHILAVSGLHMSLVSGLIFAIVQLASMPVAFFSQIWPIRKISAVMAILGASIYLVLSGASIATCRAYIMILVMFSAVIFDRYAMSMRNVALSACCILLLQPESLLSPGFQMSFAAVVALISIHETRFMPALSSFRKKDQKHVIAYLLSRSSVRLIGYFLSILGVTLVASLATAPFGAYHFHRVSPFSILANLYALPIVSLFVMPMGIASLASFPLNAESLWLPWMGLGVAEIIRHAQWIMTWPASDMRVGYFPWHALIFSVIGGLWFFIWQTRWRFWGLAPILLSCALIFTARGPDILISGTGNFLLIRHGDSNRMESLGRVDSFLARTWLEWIGENELPEPTEGFFDCDDFACIAPLHSGDTLSLVKNPKGFSYHCSRSRIVVLLSGVPETCIGPEVILTKEALKTHGTHAIWVDRRKIVMRRAKPFPPGTRPWISGHP